MGMLVKASLLFLFFAVMVVIGFACRRHAKNVDGFVLGGLEGMRYQEYEIQLDPGDKLFVYTDGVPEAMDCNKHLFGLDRMLQAIGRCPEKSPKHILTAVKKAVDDYVGDAEQFDDLTMLCLEYMGPEAADGESDGQR